MENNKPTIVTSVLKVDKTIVGLFFLISPFFYKKKNCEGRNLSALYLLKLGFKNLILEKKLVQKRS